MGSETDGQKLAIFGFGFLVVLVLAAGAAVLHLTTMDPSRLERPSSTR